jgi:hypothetical protein
MVGISALRTGGLRGELIDINNETSLSSIEVEYNHGIHVSVQYVLIFVAST